MSNETSLPAHAGPGHGPNSTAPFMATLLIAATAKDLAPAWYLVGTAVISLIAVALSRETCNEPLRRE